MNSILKALRISRFPAEFLRSPTALTLNANKLVQKPQQRLEAPSLPVRPTPDLDNGLVFSVVSRY